MHIACYKSRQFKRSRCIVKLPNGFKTNVKGRKMRLASGRQKEIQVKRFNIKEKSRELKPGLDQCQQTIYTLYC